MHYFMYMYALGIVLCLWITPYLYGVTSDIQGCHGDAWDYMWPTCRSATSRVPVGLSDWPPKYGAVRLRDVWGPRGMSREFS